MKRYESFLHVSLLFTANSRLLMVNPLLSLYPGMFGVLWAYKEFTSPEMIEAVILDHATISPQYG